MARAIVKRIGADTDWVNAGTVTFGAAVTAPTKGTSTTVVDEVWYRRVGDTAEVRMAYGHSTAGTSTAGSGEYYFQMPAGLVIDVTKLTASSTAIANVTQHQNKNSVGFALGSSNGSGVEMSTAVIVHDANNVKCGGVEAIFTGNTGASGAFTSSGTPFNGGIVFFTLSFTVPIVGWSTNS